MPKTKTAPAIPQDGKHIRYDRETGDYMCFLNGEFIGYAPNYSDGETLCENTYYAQLSHTSAPAQEPAPEALAIEVEPIYRAANGDLTDRPTDQVAYLDYRAMAGADLVIVSVSVDSDEEPDVLLFGRDGVPLSRFLASVAVVQRLLADPRVLACQAA